MDSFVDTTDPVAAGYRRVRRAIRNVVILVFFLIFMVVGWGIPSVQTTYRTSRTRGIPTAMDKIDADYWNPFFGWRLVKPGEFAAGCPFLVFIPLHEFVDLSPYKNPITSAIVPDGFFGDHKRRWLQ